MSMILALSLQVTAQVYENDDEDEDDIPEPPTNWSPPPPPLPAEQTPNNNVDFSTPSSTGNPSFGGISTSESSPNVVFKLDVKNNQVKVRKKRGTL